MQQKKKLIKDMLKSKGGTHRRFCLSKYFAKLKEIAMKEILYPILEHIEFVISVISIAVVIYGALIAVVQFIKGEVIHFSGKEKLRTIMVIRSDLGVYLLLGLELLIAADIIKTILNPALIELLTLGGIVLLRTILSVFLEREMKGLKELSE